MNKTEAITKISQTDRTAFYAMFQTSNYNVMDRERSLFILRAASLDDSAFEDCRTLDDIYKASDNGTARV
jgi:hypothetical protein